MAKKKRRLLVYPEMQTPLIFANMAILLGLTAVFVAAFYAGNSKLIGLGEMSGFDTNHTYFKFIQYQASVFYKYIALGSVVGMALSTFVTLWISRRMAGPIVKLESYFDKMAENGKFQEIKFRKDDYLHPLGKKINKALKKKGSEHKKSA